MSSFSITGNLVDVHQEKIYPAKIVVERGKIVSVVATEPSYGGGDAEGYILPGFIDSHVHIESSMLVPSEFAKLAVVHGTVATISDPHEIANVCGIEGVEFMIENGKTVPFKFNFGAPSCVPATVFETAGAALDAIAVEKLLQRDEIKYLSEMMNFPGVLFKDEEVMKKIAAAHRLGKPVDGHAPGLRGEDARRYIQAYLNTAPLNPPQVKASPNPSEGGALDTDSSAPLNPPQGGTLDSDNSSIHYKDRPTTPINTTSKASESENPPLEGREALSPGGALDTDSSAPLNPPQGGTLDSDNSSIHYKDRPTTPINTTSKASESENPPLEGREALSLGGTLDTDSSAPLNPPQGGTLDSDNSSIHYKNRPTTPINTTSKASESENPPLEGREALSPGGTLDSDSSSVNYTYNYHTAAPEVYGLLKKFVKQHRENPTHAENVLWHLLRGRQLDGYKFRRQHIIGSYIADFVCLNKRLIIEVDGLIHQIPENKISDAERTFELNKLGFDVIRFTNEEITMNSDVVLNKIVTRLSETTSKESESENPPLEGRVASPSGEEAIISTDHECFTAEEALDKLQYGMKIIIREGSAAKNFEALASLLNDHAGMMMFCSDDKHPDSLVLGHINQLCARAVAKGIDLFKILKAACVNPVHHYKLDVGLLKTGDAADFIVVKDLENFKVLKTFINGELVAENGKSNIVTETSPIINNFSCGRREPDDFAISATNSTAPGTTRHIPLVVPVIEALDGQLITNKLEEKGKIEDGRWVSDTQRDILKIVVVNRYKETPVAKAFIKNFGLKQGALASSVAHDSHNIVAVGVDDESICKAVNMIIEHRGGVSCVKDNLELIVPLPVGGLMSNEDGYHVAQQYSLIDKAAKEAGSTLSSPFMTLSFMALLVIPHLKLSDKGLFDGDKFTFVD